MGRDIVYVNLELRNDSIGTNRALSLEEVRDPDVVKDPEHYECAIDRISISKAFLPMYEDVRTLTVRMVRKSDGAVQQHSLDFSVFTDANGLMWNTEFFVEALNAALGLCTSGLGIGAVTAAVANGSNLATLDYSAQVNFASGYEVYVNEPLYAMLSSFAYTGVMFQQEFFQLALKNQAPYTTVTAEAINLSPVDKIFVKSNQMPIRYEYTPTATSGNASRNSEAIVTDFSFNGSNNYPLTNISYTATEGQYRFHAMDAAHKFDTVDLQFYFTTYNNNSYPLYIIPSGSANVKMLFRRKPTLG